MIRRGQEAAQMLTTVRSAEEGAQLDAFNQLLIIRQLLLASHRHGLPRSSCLQPPSCISFAMLLAVSQGLFLPFCARGSVSCTISCKQS